MFKKKPLKIGLDCPSCGAIMGVEEVDWNKCGSCGYPETEGEEDGEDNDDEND